MPKKPKPKSPTSPPKTEPKAESPTQDSASEPEPQSPERRDIDTIVQSMTVMVARLIAVEEGVRGLASRITLQEQMLSMLTHHVMLGQQGMQDLSPLTGVASPAALSHMPAPTVPSRVPSPEELVPRGPENQSANPPPDPLQGEPDGPPPPFAFHPVPPPHDPRFGPDLSVPQPDWIPVYHIPSRRDRSPGCRDIAQYITRVTGVDEVPSLDLLRVRPPGESYWRAPTPNDAPRCSACGTAIDPYGSADLDFSALRALQFQASPPPSLPPLSSQVLSGEAAPAHGEVRARIVRKPVEDFLPAHTPEAASEVQDRLHRLEELSRQLLAGATTATPSAVPLDAPTPPTPPERTFPIPPVVPPHGTER